MGNKENIYTTTSVDDLTQGSVEIIEMGVIADGDMGPAEDGGLSTEIDVDESADGIIRNGDRSIIDGLRHDASGVLGLTVISMRLLVLHKCPEEAGTALAKQIRLSR
jgi:hypothetical protein